MLDHIWFQILIDVKNELENWIYQYVLDNQGPDISSISVVSALSTQLNLS